MPRRVLVALIAGAMILFLTLGVRQGFGLFLAPMSADLGTSSGAYASPSSVWSPTSTAPGAWSWWAPWPMPSGW